MHPVEHELLERRSAPQQDGTQRWPWPGGVPSTRDYVKHSAVVGEVSCAVDPARQRGGPVRDAEHGDVRALSAKAFQQLELASARQVGYIRKARHIFKVCSSAHAGGSEVKQVYHAREIRLSGIPVDHCRERDSIVDEMVHIASSEIDAGVPKGGRGPVYRDSREGLELGDVGLLVLLEGVHHLKGWRQRIA